MHNPEVKVGWPAWIFFTEEVHDVSFLNFISKLRKVLVDFKNSLK